jgi:lipopolysaccharide heptosyltransferase I
VRPPSRILILRTSALGDVVHCLPVLAALRRHLPAARLGWVVEEAMAPLLAGHPDLDLVLTVRLRPWRRRPLGGGTPGEVVRFLRRLRGFGADTALDLMGNHKAGILARLSGARRRIGPARPWRREPESAVWIDEPVPLPDDAHHAVDRALAVAAALGLPRHEPADFGGAKLFAGGEPPGTAARLERAGLDGRPFALLHPAAGWRNKEYPPERWGEVARRLAQESGLLTLVTAGPGEDDRGAAVAAAADGAARVTAGTDLPTLAALIRRAALVLGGDTGPLHLARALGAPVLAVHGPTDPARHGPYAAPGGALAHRLPCSYCYKRFDEVKACLLAVPAETVAERALALLGETGRGG